MEREGAKRLAASILNLRLQAKATELSGTFKHAKMVYGWIRRIAAKKVENRFLRRILMIADGSLHLVVMKLEKRAAMLKEERRKIQEALKDLSAGQLNSTVELLEESSHPLRGRIDSDIVLEGFYDVWFIDLITVLKKEGE